MTQGHIATPHRAASDAGAAALERGGNALDAALAAAAVLTVVYPHNCALGGDLFALVHEPGGRVVAVNASGPAAGATDVDALRARTGGAMPTHGPDTVTLPGLVAGWGELHALGARLPWRDALATAARFAEEGAVVVPGLAAAIAEAPSIATDPGMGAVFAPDGARLRAGETLRQPALAGTLARLMAGGARAFYDGSVAEVLVDGVRALGSALAVEDFATYAAQRTDPLAVAVGAELEVLTSPPNSAGVLLAQALLALDAADLRDPLGADAGVLARVFAAGAAQRDRELADPKAHAFDREGWLGADRIAALAGEPGVVGGPRPTGDTVAVVAADADGWAVSLIQSLFHAFGAGILEPGTGVILQNRGASFSLAPDHPNVLAPGKRPAHTLMPVMVRRDGRLAGVLGTMGGRAQAQIHVQVLLRLLAGATAAEAVAAPRFAVGAIEMGDTAATVRVEQDCDTAAIASLAAAGFAARVVERHSDDLGHAQAIWLDGAGSDPRADGAARSRV
ncbi:Glutathione hydrolase-like YwrD proenzyme [Baekduia alba]|uniref:gamma-glutamyltransferase n=1 Tax=Baekduia alba TaxID=2997333 RepID=UPI00234082BD|nr:gamma-glutamyltransferase [Baekduia alba]WCB92238.1 Glutathione hydrolase-like YwrD proenzyme [Baekduia alba]